MEPRPTPCGAWGSRNCTCCPLAELEAGDSCSGRRQAPTLEWQVEYYFTLSPCWPHWLLRARPEIAAITYLDADLMFWSSPAPFFAEIAAAGASVGITAHRYPVSLRSLEKWGRFNVGIQYFRRDAAGLAVLADWRARCLEWCHDRLEPDRFADQKYLDAWPERFGRAVPCCHASRHQCCAVELGRESMGLG